MNEESRLLMLIWASVSDYISGGDKQQAADSLVESFVECGHEVEELYDADGECPFIDRALATVAAQDADDGSDTFAGDEEEWEI
jgi:hypothetical protein